MSINHVTLAGRIGRIETRQAGSTTITEFSLPTDRPAAKGAERVTDWHRVVCFSGLAATVYDRCAKGDHVTVLGRIQYREWVDKDGNKRVTPEIVADRVEFDARHCGPNAGAPVDAAPGKPRAPKPDTYDTHDDIPF